MDNIKLNREGGRNSCQFGCFASKLGRDYNSLNKSRVKAFTLAEVLITIVIIGIVAALTIPSVIVNYKKRQIVTQLKKTYSELSQTTNRAIADYGPIKTWEVEGESGNGETKAFVDKYIAPYLNVAKNCGYGTSGDCEFKWTTMRSPSNLRVRDNKHYKLILNDGVSLIFTSASRYETRDEHPYRVAGVAIYIDTNGQNGPNAYGKDIFVYQYNIDNDSSANEGGADLTGKFTPQCVNLSREELLSNCNAQGNGGCCAALIMQDGWKMNDYYPL